MLISLVALGWFGEGLAKMDWIYKELRSKQDAATANSLYEELLNVPQYFRFNTHYDVAINVDEHLDPNLQQSWLNYKTAGSHLMNDDNFSHIFKRVKTEHLLTGMDGDFISMECSAWLDLSHEVERSLTNEPTWKTDYSLIKSVERNDIDPLQPISDELADQLLRPLLGHCLG